MENMFYFARQFCIHDLHGYELYFIQPDWMTIEKSLD
jgi:hypothetical protein